MVFRVSWTGLWVVLVCAAPCHAQERATIGTAAAVTAIVAHIGITEGMFADFGINADMKRLPGGNDTIQALLGGAIDFAESSNAQFLSAVAKGMPLVGIGLHSHGYLGKLIAAEQNSHLRTLQDFKGKRIGIQFGTGVYTVFLMALERQGLKASDFVLSNVRVNDMPAAMTSDTFDAVLAWEPQARRILEMGRGTEVITARQFEEMADITYPFVIMTTQRIARERGDFVQRFVKGVAKSQRFIAAHRSETVKRYRSLLPPDIAASISDHDLMEQIYSSHYDRIVLNDADISDLRRTAEFLHRQGTLSVVPDLSKAIDLRFSRTAASLPD